MYQAYCSVLLLSVFMMNNSNTNNNKFILSWLTTIIIYLRRAKYQVRTGVAPGEGWRVIAPRRKVKGDFSEIFGIYSILKTIF